MNCQEVKSFLFRYLDGSLSVPQEKVFYNHLSGCLDCQRELAQARKTNQLLEQTITLEMPPADLVDKVMAGIGSQGQVTAVSLSDVEGGEQQVPSPGRPVKKRLAWTGKVRTLAAAACLALFMVIGSLTMGDPSLSALAQNVSNLVSPIKASLALLTDGQKENPSDEPPPVKTPQQGPQGNSGDLADQLNQGGLTELEPGMSEEGLITVTLTVLLNPLAVDGEFDQIHPVWSPDGEEVWYLSQKEASGGRYRVWRAGADGSTPEVQGSLPYGIPLMGQGGVWSPNRDALAYVSDRNGYWEVWVDDLSGHATNLTLDSSGQITERLSQAKGEELEWLKKWAFAPVWSDKGEIAFFTSRNGTLDLMAVDRRGNSRVIANSQADEMYPSWSPDSSSLAYFSGWTEADQSWGEVLVADRQGGSRYSLTGKLAVEAMVPSWSPDGRQLALNLRYKTGDGEMGGGIWLVNTDGTELKRLTEIGGGNLVSWSPDGSKLVFNSYEGGIYALVFADDHQEAKLWQVAQGAAEQEVSANWSADSKDLLLDWVPEGKSIRGIWQANFP
jgi:Tol biopolymer transport system component